MDKNKRKLRNCNTTDQKRVPTDFVFRIGNALASLVSNMSDIHVACSASHRLDDP